MAVLSSVLTATTAMLAQGQNGGLYGATRSSGGGRDQLNIEWWLGQAITSGLPSEFRDVVTGADPAGSQSSTVLAASGTYARNRQSVRLLGTFSTYYRYGFDLDRLAAVSQDGELTASFRLPSNARLSVSQAVTYSPAYLYQLFPTAAPLTLGEAAPINPVYRTDSTLYRTSVDATFGSARGTQVTTTADYSLTNFHQQSASALDLSTYGAGAKFSQALSRNGGISIAYHYETGDSTLGGITREHRVTIGGTYSPALSRTRKAMLRLELSPSVVESPDLAGAAERQSHFQGEAGVTYPFRPKWTADVSYRRAVDYVVGFREPTLSSGTRLEVTGIIAHRFDVKAMAGHATGSSAISANYQNVGTWTGEARLRYALSRRYALFGEYLYSSFDLRQQIGVLPGVPAVYHVNEVRVGLTGFTPLLGK